MRWSPCGLHWIQNTQQKLTSHNYSTFHISLLESQCRRLQTMFSLWKIVQSIQVKELLRVRQQLDLVITKRVITLTWDNGLQVFQLAGDCSFKKLLMVQSPHSEECLLMVSQQVPELDGTGIKLASSPVNLWVPQPIRQLQVLLLIILLWLSANNTSIQTAK